MKIYMILAAAMALLAAPGMVRSQQSQPDHAMHQAMPGNDAAKQAGGTLPVPDLLTGVASRPPIGLADFLRIAGQSNPTLNQARALVSRSEAQAHQAGLYPNPTVGYQGEQIRGGSYGGGEQGAFVQQTIVLGGKLGLRRAIDHQRSLSDQIGVAEQTDRVQDDIAQAFYTALASQATVDVRRSLLGVAMDAVETVHQLANVGQADEPDILQTEVEAEEAGVDYVTAQRKFLEDFRALAAVAGKPDLLVSPLRGTLEDTPELDAEQQVAKIVASSPSVQRAKQEVVVAEAKLRDARREAVPDLQLRAGAQYNGEQLGQPPMVKAAGPQGFATAGIQLPLWNRNQGNIDAAKAELERRRQDVLRIQLSLRQQAETLAQSYLAARFRAQRYRTELIPHAQRAHDLYLKKYQEMAQAYPQVLISQRTLFQLQIGYLTALKEVWTNAVALQHSTLSGGLSTPGASGSSSTMSNLPNGGGME